MHGPKRALALDRAARGKQLGEKKEEPIIAVDGEEEPKAIEIPLQGLPYYYSS